MRKLLILLFIISLSDLKAQNVKPLDTIPEDVFWRMVLEPTKDELDSTEEINIPRLNLFVPSKPIIRFENVFIKKAGGNKWRIFLKTPRTINHQVELRNIEFYSRYNAIKLDSIIFKEQLDISIQIGYVKFNSCEFRKSIWIANSGASNLEIRNSVIKERSFLFQNSNPKDTWGGLGWVLIDSCLIESSQVQTINASGDLSITNSIFRTKDSSQHGDSTWLSISGDMQRLVIERNIFSIPVILSPLGSAERLIDISENRFTFFTYHNFTLPEDYFNNYIKWNQLSDSYGRAFSYKLEFSGGGFKPRWKIISMKSDSGIVDQRIFDDITANVHHLHSIYKSRGDITSANQCYADIKKFETRRWKYLFEQNKTFESFFRWQLNAFLSYFTDYGTNPAKAVIKSGWVILLFAIFYLFFPSDWDVSNRSQLLSKVKDLTSKNREKSFIATLAFVTYSAFIHILNALTLSLNAFTTLGFGDIPTHGAARYVTIVQGFIGWFLLTIFSVSLINQVLG